MCVCVYMDVFAHADVKLLASSSLSHTDCTYILLYVCVCIDVCMYVCVLMCVLMCVCTLPESTSFHGMSLLVS